MAANENAKVKLIDLDTSCLIRILKYLNYDDLYNLNQTHSSFNAAIEHVVSTKKFLFCIPAVYTDEWIVDYEKSLEKMQQINNFLKVFGRDIQYLNIEFNCKSDKFYVSLCNLFETAIECYCSNGNVKHCTFGNFNLRTEFVNDSGKFFKSMESLQIGNVVDEMDFYRIMDLVVLQGNLKMFTAEEQMLCSDTHTVFQKIAASHLETCIIDCESSWQNIDVSSMSPHSKPNLTLKHLELRRLSYDLRILVKYFPNIEQLNYWVEKNPPDPILQLTKLKKLSLDFYMDECFEHVSFFQQLGKRNQLESLKLTILIDSIFIDNRKKEQFIVALCKMTTLKSLKLHMDFAVTNYLVKIGRSLKGLKKFDFTIHIPDANNKQKSEMMQALLDFIKSSKALCTLKLWWNFDHLQKFYDELVLIRQIRSHNAVLNVHLLPWVCKSITATPEQQKFVKIISEV